MLDIELHLKEILLEALKKLNQDVDIDNIIIERSKEKIHGDYATNIAMQIARVMHQAPKVIAEQIVNLINDEVVEKIEIAGPGFINFFIKQESLNSLIKTIIDQNQDYGNSSYGNHEKINVEFVSANPTGDLHL